MLACSAIRVGCDFQGGESDGLQKSSPAIVAKNGMVVSRSEIGRVKRPLRVQNGQKTVWGSCENVIFIRNAGTNPKVMAVRSKINVNRKNLIISLADSCFEFLRDLEKEDDPDLVRRRAAEFAEDVRRYSRLIELT
jgi:hypothetical protein